MATGFYRKLCSKVRLLYLLIEKCCLSGKQRENPPRNVEDSDLQERLDVDDSHSQWSLADQLGANQAPTAILLYSKGKVQKVGNSILHYATVRQL